MDFETDISPAPNATLQRLYEMRVMQLLLAGLYFLLGPSVQAQQERAVKDAQREEALRWREIIRQANVIIEAHYAKIDQMAKWTGDRNPHWRRRMAALRNVVRTGVTAAVIDAHRTLCANTIPYSGPSAHSLPKLPCQNRGDRILALAPP